MLRDVPYTAKHYVAFQRTAIQLGHWRPHYLLHDLGKMLLLCFFEKKKLHSFHQRISIHHVGNIWGIHDTYQMIVDWECARYTKPDKPLNAYDTLSEFYPDIEDKILPKLKKLGIARSGNCPET